MLQRQNSRVTWKNYKVYEEIPNEDQRIISFRWVCIEKPTYNGTAIKARLVAKGSKKRVMSFVKDLRHAQRKVCA